MKKRKVLIIGSGPIIIGQAAEFDYSGTQACLALKEEGYEVVLINPNPATIMTDKEIADKIYLEPLTLNFCKWVIVKENINFILGTLGGQVALNLVFNMKKVGYLKKYNIKILGTSVKAIEICESRKKFKEEMKNINIPVAKSSVVSSYEEALKEVKKYVFPLIIRPSFTMGGAGGGVVSNIVKFKKMIKNALQKSPVGECLIEESLLNYKEIEYEVIRDKYGSKMIVCNMENIDPVGVHTGDSYVVAPSLTINNDQYNMLRTSSLKIIEHMKIEGGCNVQFALNPFSNDYYVIEVNPRVSRSSALASKATGYPIAKISVKISVGRSLGELISPITNKTKTIFEPTLDYVVVKFPVFSFDKFGYNNDLNILSTQMQATGEVMSIGSNFIEAFLKSIRCSGRKNKFIWLEKYNKEYKWNTKKLLFAISKPNENRIYQIYELIRRNIKCKLIHENSGIDLFFLNQFKKIYKIERLLIENVNKIDVLVYAKKYGFSDYAIAKLWKISETEVQKIRIKNKIYPYYKVVDTCSNEFESVTPYYYSTYTAICNDIKINNKKTILILGSGPIRVGQGIEFDYSIVHAINSIKSLNYKTAIINNNPETVSTDYTVSDYLFFEPISTEDIINLSYFLKPKYLLLQFGGQIALDIFSDIENIIDIKILGTSSINTHKSEDRGEFIKAAKKNNILVPNSIITNDLSKIESTNNKLKYPVLIRPSYVIAGRAMEILYSDDDSKEYIKKYKDLLTSNEILIDKYINGKEFEIDAVSDGVNIWVPAILEHIERAGIHSGDSTLLYPHISLSEKYVNEIIEITRKMAKEFNVIGLMNIQFIQDEITKKIYVIEVNLRSSRTIPFVSKIVKISVVDVAIKVLLGISLKEQNKIGHYPIVDFRYYIKSPVFSFHKLFDSTSSLLGPEMQSTGESWGCDSTISKALYKSLLSANVDLLRHHSVVISINKNVRSYLLQSFLMLSELGYTIYATRNTHKWLTLNNIKSFHVNKISDRNNIIDLIQKTNISYIINIVGDNYKKKADLQTMRKVARNKNIAVITSTELAKAVCKVCHDVKFSILRL